VGYAGGEEWYLKAKPDKQTGPHDFPGPEDIRESAAEPGSYGRADAVGSKHNGDLPGREVQFHQVRRQKARFNAIAHHKEQQAKIADGHLGMHADTLYK